MGFGGAPYILDEFMDTEEREELDEKLEDGFGERYISILKMSSEEATRICRASLRLLRARA